MICSAGIREMVEYPYGLYQVESSRLCYVACYCCSTVVTAVLNSPTRPLSAQYHCSMIATVDIP